MNQMYLPKLSRVNKFIIGAMVAFFILNAILSSFAGLSLVKLMGLSLDGIQNGFVFQFVTYPLVASGLMDVVFTGLLIWFLGSDLEKMWGQKNYISYLLLTAVFTGLFYLLISLVNSKLAVYPIYGMSIFSSAMCVSYAVIYPDRVFQFFMLIPVKAKYFCLILAGMSLYNGIFSPGGAVAWAQLFSMGIGFGFVFFVRSKYYHGIFGRLSFKGRRKSKANLKIVKDDQKPPRYWQ
jgi:membrane associated rhomboid family serine protease